MKKAAIIKVEIPNPLNVGVPEEFERYVLVRVAADLLDIEARRLLAALRSGEKQGAKDG